MKGKKILNMLEKRMAKKKKGGKSMQAAIGFHGNKREFTAYLAGVKSGKVVDINWHRINRDKKKAASRAATNTGKCFVDPSIA